MYGEIAAILTNVSFALSYVLARRIENEATPIFQNAVRTIIGFVTFFIICLAFGIFIHVFSLSIILIVVLMMSILFTITIGDTAYLQSQKTLGPAKALAITTTSPFFTILFSIIFLNRPFSILMIFSGFFIGLGVIIITKQNKKRADITILLNQQNNRNENQKRIKTLKGTLWALVAAISWAIGIAISDYSITQVKITLNLGLLATMVAMLIRYAFASLILSTMAFIEGKRKPFPRGKKTWKILIISAIVSNTIGSIFFGEAVHYAGASFMSLISTALPLFTIPFSYIINKEKLSKIDYLGVILTLIGVLLILF